MPATQEVCKCIVKIDGKTVIQGDTGGSLQTKDGWYVEYVSVDKKIDCPDMFTLDFQMSSGAKIQLLDEIREGKPIEILVGYDTEKTIFKGEISYIEPNFRNKGKSTVTISGYDRSHRLTRGTVSRTWGDGVEKQDLYQNVVKDVITKSSEFTGTSDGLSPEKVESMQAKFTYLPQMNVSDYMLLKTLGTSADKKTDASTEEDDKKVSFKKIDLSGRAVITLCREKPEGDNAVLINECKFLLSTVKQYKRVEVRGWDPKTKKNIVGVAEESDYSFGGTEGWKATGKALYGKESAGKVFTVVDHPVESKEEADAIAKAIFNQLSLDFITGEANFKGNPEITAGDIVECKGFGERFGGKYLIASCTHVLAPQAKGYSVYVKLVRNSVEKV
ncbi:MAG: hypothetical protein FJ088_00070 [Deltaproteobacteria bacterium]|nr:hypothetical protein [Deltaproteobacteria bacterium]